MLGKQCFCYYKEYIRQNVQSLWWNDGHCFSRGENTG